jgi:hypothetical protein
MRMLRSEVTPRSHNQLTIDNPFTIDTHMKLYFAGITHAGQSHVREQIRVTLKSPLVEDCTYINTCHSHFLPEGVAETSKVFFRDAHVLPK